MSEENKITEEIKEEVKDENVISDAELDEVSGGGGFISGYVTYMGYRCRIYQVTYGDCLSVIAQRTHANMYLIAQLNGIQNINLIRVGQRLYIPQ